ncbi:MAG: hypothetical protein WB647_10370 [Roseiarcus sp.]|jgi:hypothetical protein|uniref:hypothetical protein n=1 Tax=Roseiarcus sp. TaxID=1969460 RepID=UPI003C6A7862
MRGFARAIWVAIGLLAGAPGFAADLPTKKPAPAPVPVPAIPSTWRYEITGYGWASSIAGSTGFGALPTLPYYASFGKVLEHFQGAFMGSVVARNDMFIGGIDFVWARIGGSAVLQNQDNVLYGGKTDLTLNEAFITAFGGVRVPLGVPNLDLYGTVGARNFYSGTKLTVSGPFGLFNGTESVNKDWIMPVGGFAAQYRFDDRWFMNTLADLGGWSDSATGQALSSVGYNWTQNISTTLGYRVMYTYTHQDTGTNLAFQPRSFRYQQWMYGPFAGFKYGF